MKASSSITVLYPQVLEHSCMYVTINACVKDALILQYTGAGIFGFYYSVPVRVLPNNGIVIARAVTSGSRILLHCRSGSTMTGVGQFVDLNGNTFSIGTS